MKKLLVVLSACLILPLSTQASDEIIALGQCYSQTLKVEFNPLMSKKMLVKGLAALLSYPSLKVRMVSEVGPVFSVSTDLCQDASCENDKDWDVLQWRLKTIKGVEVQCEEPAGGAQDQKQEATPPRMGGVTGST